MPKKEEHPKIKNKIFGICAFISGMLLGWGLPMILGYEFAPWLIAVGVLAISVIICLDDYVRYRLKNKKSVIKILLYAILILICVPVFIFSQMRVNQIKENASNTMIFNSYITPGAEPNPVSPNAYVINLGDDQPITNDRITVMFGDKVGAYLRMCLSC